MKSISDKILTLAVIIISGLVLAFWLFYNPAGEIVAAVPGLDNRPAGSGSSTDTVVIGQSFTVYDSTFSTSLTGKWPNFRGADFDNINKENIRLIDSWPADGPDILWSQDLGEGHAAAAIYNGRVYMLDYDERRRADLLHCYSLVDGRELWRRWYAVDIKRNHGMSRTIPAVNDEYVVTIGPRGHVMCSNAVDGSFVWGIDLEKEYKTTVPLWYTGQCPVIDNNIAVIAPGGKALLMGVDCATGEVVWETPNPDGLQMSHSSVVPMTIDGKKMYVYNALGGLVGVSAEDVDMGRLLWKTSDFNANVIAPSPLYVGNNRIYVSAGYGSGAALFRINSSGTGYSVETLQKYRPAQGMASEQQTPIFSNGFVFNIQTKDAGTTRNQFVCALPNDFQKIIWTSSTEERFGLGPYIIADNKFYILNDEGEMTIARFSTSGFEVLDKTRVLEGVDSWGPIALADGYMVIRDSKKMICIDMRAE